jgi:hypoxanthine phosphoribosyltransferase
MVLPVDENWRWFVTCADVIQDTSPFAKPVASGQSADKEQAWAQAQVAMAAEDRRG